MGPQWKTVWRFLNKIRIESPYDLAIPLLQIYLEKMKTLIQNDLCALMFIAAVFTITKTWKRPKCPSVDDVGIRRFFFLRGDQVYGREGEGLTGNRN